MTTYKELAPIMKIEDLPKGEFFRRKADSKKTFVYEGYCRLARKYIGTDFYDINSQMEFKKGTLVYTDFEF
jgi:hypothetical protein